MKQQQIYVQQFSPSNGPILNYFRKAQNRQPGAALIELIQQFLRDMGALKPDEASTERLQQLVSRATPFDQCLEAFLETTMVQKGTFYNI